MKTVASSAILFIAIYTMAALALPYHETRDQITTQDKVLSSVPREEVVKVSTATPAPNESAPAADASIPEAVEAITPEPVMTIPTGVSLEQPELFAEPQPELVALEPTPEPAAAAPAPVAAAYAPPQGRWVLMSRPVYGGWRGRQYLGDEWYWRWVIDRPRQQYVSSPYSQPARSTFGQQYRNCPTGTCGR